MRARCPEDVLAMVPVLLGFTPTDSITMLTFGARHSFHARVDLPGRDDLEEVIDVLLAPALQHRVRQVVFVLHSDDGGLAERCFRGLLRAFEEAGIDVADGLRADGRRWWPLLGPTRVRRGIGTAYDVSSHPFLTQAVFAGRVTVGTREDIAATLSAAEPGHRAQVAAAAAAATPGDPDWLREAIASGTALTPDVVGRVLVTVRSAAAREVVLETLNRPDAARAVQWWTHAVAHAPDDLAATPAAILALAAWLVGNGALAWCAVDRCRRSDPSHPLADLVADLLNRAVPPSVWEEMSRPGSDDAA